MNSKRKNFTSLQGPVAKIRAAAAAATVASFADGHKLAIVIVAIQRVVRSIGVASAGTGGRTRPVVRRSGTQTGAHHPRRTARAPTVHRVHTRVHSRVHSAVLARGSSDETNFFFFLFSWCVCASSRHNRSFTLPPKMTGPNNQNKIKKDTRRNSPLIHHFSRRPHIHTPLKTQNEQLLIRWLIILRVAAGRLLQFHNI